MYLHLELAEKICAFLASHKIENDLSMGFYIYEWMANDSSSLSLFFIATTWTRRK